MSWVDAENQEISNLIGEIAQDTNEDPECADKTVESVPFIHVRASPLFELSSIKISRDLFLVMDMKTRYDNFVDDKCVIELYGHIRLVDDKGNVFTLFKLDHQHAKTVILEDSFSLILQKSQLGTPRCLPKNLKLHILLKDRIRDVVFFDDWKFLSFSRQVHYDILQHVIFDYNVERTTHKFPRLESSLEMGFTIYHCARLAYIGVTLRSVGSDNQIDSEEVKLKLQASIQLKNRKVCHDLFDESLSLKIGNPTELCVLAVPAYSLLEIQANLKFDDDEDIVSQLEVDARDTTCHAVNEMEIVGQKCRMLLWVTWNHAFDKLPENILREWDDAPSSSDSENEELDWGEAINYEKPSRKKPSRKKPSRKKPFPSSFEKRLSRSTQESLDLAEVKSDEIGYFIQPQLQSLCKRRWVTCSGPGDLVELFCVSICSFDGALSIAGEIDVYRGLGTLKCFSLKEIKAGILYPRLTCDCLLPTFAMTYDLKDAKGHQISEGYLEYNDTRVVRWYNRRVCSVIPGKHGYAAAYYTIVHDAVQARVKFTLMPANGVEYYVSGSIHGRYSNYNYSTKYEKDYFQSILYEKGKSVLVKGGDGLPLKKSVIPVPSIASLVLKVDLNVLVDGERIETLKGKVIFKPRDPNEQQIFSGLNSSSSTFSLSVSVVWGYPEFIRKFDSCSISS